MSEASSRSIIAHLTLRGFDEGDREVVLDLWVAAWRAVMPEIDFEERREWFHTHLARLERPDWVIRCAIGSRSRRILGFVALSPTLRQLDQIVVDLDHWGKGVGDALLDEAKRLSPRGLCLDVNEDNTRAITFYEKHGFRRLGGGRNQISGLPTFRYGWGEIREWKGCAASIEQKGTKS